MKNLFKIGTSKDVLETVKHSLEFFGNAFLPRRAFIPIGYKEEENIYISLHKGSLVREGQLLARGGALSPYQYVYSSIPGVVTDFKDFEIEHHKVLRTIEVSLKGSFDILGKPNRTLSEWMELSPVELFDRIEKSGVANTADRIVCPLSFKLKLAMNTSIQQVATTFIDFHPTQSLDIFLSQKYPNALIEGALIIARILKAKELVIFHNIKDKKILSKYSSIVSSLNTDVDIKFKKVKMQYPLSLNVSSSFFIDASTSLYTYDAISSNAPLLSVYVSIQGNIVKKPKIFKVRIGTPIGSLIEECGGIKAMPEAIVINGLTSGYAIKNLDIPIDRHVKSIHVVSKDMLNSCEEMDCINCGKCFVSCPCNIDPIGTLRSIRKKAITEEVACSIKQCNGCACCSIVCPSRIAIAREIISYKDEHYYPFKDESYYRFGNDFKEDKADEEDAGKKVTKFLI